MAKMISLSSLAFKAAVNLLILAMTLRCAYPARILTGDDGTPALVPQPQPPVLAGVAKQPAVSFFMHDILGGSAPTGRVVAGIIANTQINGIPFSKPNGGVFPISGGVPLVTANNGVINNRNLPFIAGLNGGSTSTVISNNGNNNIVANGNPLPFVTAGQLPQGATLQNLMFGTITVIDDELTEDHELGSSVIGKAKGFYLASSVEGSSQTMAFTALLGEHEENTLSFFGVHRTPAHESLIAVVGGSGKYENARGYATIETLHSSDQHTTDGVDTVIQFGVYLSN